jgi:hypothetical protein
MDDATADEQPVVGFVEGLAFLFMDKALQGEGMPVIVTAAGRCNDPHISSSVQAAQATGPPYSYIASLRLRPRRSGEILD